MRRAARILSLLLLPAAALASGGCTLNSLFLFPKRGLDDHPRRHGYECEDVTFRNEGGHRLSAWLVRARGARRGTVLLSHGNGGNIAAFIAYALFLADAGFDVLSFDYQGYGDSQGPARVQALGGDMRAAISYLRSRKDLDQERVAFYGISLGTALAIAAARRAGPVKAVVLEGAYIPFRHIYRMCGGCFLTYPLAWLIYRWAVPADVDIEKDIEALEGVPVLFITGEADRTTPAWMARALYERKRGPKEIWTPEGVGHCSDPLHGREGGEYRRRVSAFLSEHLVPDRTGGVAP